MAILLLQEQVHMFLLDRKGERKVLDVERQLLGIVEAQHIDLLCDLFDTTLEFSNTRLFLCVFLDDIGHHIHSKANTLRQ